MKNKKEKHARLSPSISKRWIECPGSIILCEKLPKRPTSSYAIEGTNAHKLAEICLNENKNTSEYVGQTIEEFLITYEMAEAVQEYLDSIRSLISQEDIDMKRKHLYVEKKFKLKHIHKDVYGTSDCSIYDVSGKKLFVFDYKHGQGQLVDPEWNSQLMIYALGALYNIWDQQTPKTRKFIKQQDIVKTVVLGIIQPRCSRSEETTRCWQISSEGLVEWGATVLKEAAKRTEKKDAPLKEGDHCRWCDALAVCPKHIKSVTDIAGSNIDKPKLPDPALMSASQISKVLRLSKVIKMWASEIESYALNRMEEGLEIPGYKLVKRRSIRKWINETEVLDTLNPILGNKIFKKTLLSVKQMEDMLKKNNVSPESTVAGLYEKPDNGLTIAPEEDKRKAVVLSSAALDFIDEAAFLQ